MDPNPALRPADRILDDEARLKALADCCRGGDCGGGDDAHHPEFDRVTSLVARVLGVPVALVSLVDDRRQWFASAHGRLPGLGAARGTPLSHSLCKDVVASRAPLVLRDARSDPAYAAHPAVRELGVAAYAGVPLVTPDGHALGSLCAIDMAPRPWSAEDVATLSDFAAFVVAEVEARRRLGRERRAGEELAAARLKFEAFMEHCPAVAFIKDADGRHLYENARFAEHFGEAARDWVGKTEVEIFGPEVAAMFAEKDRRAWASPDGVSYEETTPASGGNRETTWLTYKFPMDMPDGARLLGGLSFDITDRKRTEAELARLRDAAEAASVAKGRFLAHMSHEVRTPLTAILGYADLLGTPGVTAADRGAYVGVIRRNGEHLLALLNDVLDASKIEAGGMTVERVPVALPQLIGDVLPQKRRRAAAKGLTLDVAFETPVPQTIECDPTRLRQVLINLIGNAIKFTETGGVTVRLACAGDRLRIAVEDSGIGLAPEQVGRLFEAFRQADDSHTRLYGGTGLGLAISRRLARLLGGDVTVESRQGVGSTFTLELPLGGASPSTVTALPPAGPTAAPAAAPLPRLGGRVLVAEDGPDNQWLIAAYLRRVGAAAEVVADGAAAVEAALAAEAAGEPFDLILMDCQMPVTDGPTATRQLRAAGYRRPVVALTASATGHDRDACLAAGCDEFLTKPLQLETFIDAIAPFLPHAAGAGASAAVGTTDPCP